MRRPSNLLADPPSKGLIPAPAEKAASYLDLYGLSKPPFGKPSENGGYILFNSHRPVFERLVDHMVNGTGLIVVSGEEGVGKSEMLAAAGQVAGEAGLQIITPERLPHRGIDRAHLLSAIFDDAPENAGSPIDAQAAVRALLGPPRSVLVLDDGELLTQDCHPILMSILEQRATGLAVVMTLNPALHPVSSQPPFVRLAQTRLQIPRLSSAEMRQYIERGLWIAGGTTRRLLAPDAIRLIVTAASGLPGSVNRIMEGVFTAGFARADPLITARTVSTVVGSPASRSPDSKFLQDTRPRHDDAPPQDTRQPPVDPAPSAQTLRGSQPREEPPPVPPSAPFQGSSSRRGKPALHDDTAFPSTPSFNEPSFADATTGRGNPRSPSSRAAQADQTWPPLQSDQPSRGRRSADNAGSVWTRIVIPVVSLAILLCGITAFLYRGLGVGDAHPPADASAGALLNSGQTSLAQGNVAAARLMFQHAAELGNARAATEAGKTYDPAFQTAGTDPAQAAAWYRRAISLGDPQANSLLQRLLAGLAKPTAP